MAKKPRYGYRRDRYGRPYESDTYKDDVEISAPEYDYSSYDKEDDHDNYYSSSNYD